MVVVGLGEQSISYGFGELLLGKALIEAEGEVVSVIPEQGPGLMMGTNSLWAASAEIAGRASARGSNGLKVRIKDDSKYAASS